jgi:hypothetical protein
MNGIICFGEQRMGLQRSQAEIPKSRILFWLDLLNTPKHLQYLEVCVATPCAFIKFMIHDFDPQMVGTELCPINRHKGFIVIETGINQY